MTRLDLDATYAQTFVEKRAAQYGYLDSFLSFIPLDSLGEAVILSEMFLYWRRPGLLWGRVSA